MAISAKDKKLAAIGGGMFLGGQVTNKTMGQKGGPTGYVGSAASMGGGTVLGMVGAGELIELIGSGSRAQMRHYRDVGENMMKGAVRGGRSFASRHADSAKLLALKIAQGANKII